MPGSSTDGSDGGVPPDVGGAGGGALKTPGGERMMKQAGPALRWLACDDVGLPVVFT